MTKLCKFAVFGLILVIISVFCLVAVLEIKENIATLFEDNLSKNNLVEDFSTASDTLQDRQQMNYQTAGKACNTWDEVSVELKNGRDCTLNTNITFDNSSYMYNGEPHLFGGTIINGTGNTPTLYGNGKTITISVSSNSKLVTTYQGGLTGELEKVKLRDFNIVVDRNLIAERKSGSSNYYTGLIAGRMSNVELDNVNITLNTDVGYNSFSDSKAVSLGAYAGRITGNVSFRNCVLTINGALWNVQLYNGNSSGHNEILPDDNTPVTGGFIGDVTSGNVNMTNITIKGSSNALIGSSYNANNNNGSKSHNITGGLIGRVVNSSTSNINFDGVIWDYDGVLFTEEGRQYRIGVLIGNRYHLSTVSIKNLYRKSTNVLRLYGNVYDTGHPGWNVKFASNYSTIDNNGAWLKPATKTETYTGGDFVIPNTNNTSENNIKNRLFGIQSSNLNGISAITITRQVIYSPYSTTWGENWKYGSTVYVSFDPSKDLDSVNIKFDLPQSNDVVIGGIDYGGGYDNALVEGRTNKNTTSYTTNAKKDKVTSIHALTSWYKSGSLNTNYENVDKVFDGNGFVSTIDLGGNSSYNVKYKLAPDIIYYTTGNQGTGATATEGTNTEVKTHRNAIPNGSNSSYQIEVKRKNGNTLSDVAVDSILAVEKDVLPAHVVFKTSSINTFGIIKIKPLPYAVKPNDMSKTFGQADPTLRQSLPTAYDASITFNFTRLTGEDAGTYNFLTATSGNTNYFPITISEDSNVGKFIIKPFNLSTISWVDDNFIYNGKNQFDSIVASYQDINNQPINLKLSVNNDTGEFKDYKVGGYIFTASFKNNEKNYTLPAIVTKEYNINQFNISTINWVENNFTFNGKNQASNVTATYIDVDNRPVSLKTSLNGEFKDFKADGYVFTASFNNGETNYKLPNLVTNKFNIEKFNVTLTWVNDDFTYNGTNQINSIRVTYNDIDNIPIDLKTSFDSTEFRNYKDGGYIFTASFKNDEINYALPATFTNTYNIRKLTISTINWVDDDFTFNGKNQASSIIATYTDIAHATISLATSLDSGEFKNYNTDGYIFTASFKDGETNYKLPDTVTNKYNIKKLTISTITWVNDDFTFNGTNQASSIIATYTDIANVSINLATSLESGEFKDYKAGGYTFTASFKFGETNYALPTTNTKIYNIKKLTISTITWVDNNFTYNGTNQASNVTATYQNINDETINLKLSVNSDDNEFKDFRAEGYIFTASFNDGDINYNLPSKITNVYNIQKLLVSINWVNQTTDLTYNGEDQSSGITAIYQDAFGKDIPLKLTTIDEFKDYKEGGYLFTAGFNNNETNYSLPNEKTKVYNISKKTVAIIWIENNFTYNETNQFNSVTAKYKDVFNKDIFLKLSVENNLFLDYNKDGYTFTASFNFNENNYLLTGNTTAVYHIQKLTVQIAVPIYEQPLYYGNALPILSNGIFVKYGSYKLDEGQTLSVSQTDYNYTFTPTTDALKNHIFTNTTGKMQLTVNKATPTFSVPTNLKAIFNSLLSSVELTKGFSWNYTNSDAQTAKVGNVGVNLHKASFTPDDTANYNVVVVDIAVIVSKVKYDMQNVEFKDKAFTYDGSVKSLAVEGPLPDGVTAIYDYNNIINAGVYTITVTFKGDYDNYDYIPSRTAKLTINKIDYVLGSLSFKNTEKIYNGEIQLPDLDGELPTGHDGIKVKANFSLGLKNIGEKTINVTFTSESKNYNAITTSLSTEFKVTERVVEIVKNETYVASYIGISEISLVKNKHYLINNLVDGEELNLTFTTEWLDNNNDRILMKILSLNNSNYKIEDTNKEVTIIASVDSTIVVQFDNLESSYDNTIKTVVPTVTIGGTQTSNFEIKYFLNNSPVYPKNAGTYVVKVIILVDGLNNQYRESNLVISKIMPDFKILGSNTIQYGDSNPQVLEVTGKFNDGFYFSQKLDYNFETVYPNVGTYKTNVTFEGSENYLPFEENNITLNITKRELTLEYLGGYNVEYNGKFHSINYKLHNLIANEQNIVTVGYEEDGMGINANEYSAVVKSIDDNYKIVKEIGINSVTITKAILNVEIIGSSNINENTKFSYELKYLGFMNGEDISYIQTEPKLRQIMFKAGTYELILSGGVAKNYEFNYIPFLLNVNYVNIKTEMGDNKITIEGVFNSKTKVEVSEINGVKLFSNLNTLSNRITSAYSLNILNPDSDNATYTIRMENINSLTSMFNNVYYIDNQGNMTKLNKNIKNGTLSFNAKKDGSIVFVQNLNLIYLISGLIIGLIVALFIAKVNRKAYLKKLEAKYGYQEF